MTEGGLDTLIGARVQRIDGPHPDLIALTLHQPDRHGCLLFYAAAGRARWGWVEERPRGEPASSFVLLLRKHLENGRVIAARTTSAGPELVIRRGDSEAVLRLDVPAARMVLDADGKAIASRGASPPSRAPRPAADLAELEAAGPQIVEEAIGGARVDRARAIERAIVRRRAKLARRLRAIEGDLARVDEVEPLRRRGSLILASLATIPPDATEAEVTDWHADPPAPIKVAIDPARGPKGEAEALFRRARKLERGADVALARHAETEAELEALASLLHAIDSASGIELDDLERRAARLGARVEKAPGIAATEGRSAYRAFRADADRVVLVGRSAADNDTLTLHVARPHDHWLHARGVTGSHVIVPLSRGEDCPPQLLVDAAHLAAHFSSARGEAIVEVQHTPRRYVRKPRGAPPGAVTLTREKVIVLRVETDRLERLLGAEDHV